MSRALSRVSLPVIDGAPLAAAADPLSVPKAPSWSNLWLRVALTGTALLLLIFGGYELIERSLLDGSHPRVIHARNIARGMGAAVIIGAWASYLAMRTRRGCDGVLTTNIARLERRDGRRERLGGAASARRHGVRRRADRSAAAGRRRARGARSREDDVARDHRADD